MLDEDFKRREFERKFNRFFWLSYLIGLPILYVILITIYR